MLESISDGFLNEFEEFEHGGGFRAAAQLDIMRVL